MIMTYDRGRVASRAGKVSAETLANIDRALVIHLASPRRERWRDPQGQTTDSILRPARLVDTT